MSPSKLGNEIRSLAGRFANVTATEGDSGKVRTGTISGLEQAADMADVHYEQVECLFYMIGQSIQSESPEQAVKAISDALTAYQTDSKAFCSKAGGLLRDCPFIEVKGSQRRSEYEPSVVHYESKCQKCGERRFHTKTETMH
ncbi:hypothetical protein [Endozoicomonas lisbonensis]|uniref:Uncharacterized protein n=1 Tax=Endozoicomonas lisbonensis TaxID=3120522 RepID=A0ABV2SP44_9GAMM